MEKVILFIMILGVGLVSGFLLLSRTSQPVPSLDLNANPSVSQPQQQQQQSKPSPAAVQPIGPQEVLAPNQAIIQTSEGNITIQLFATEAANTVNNFAHRAKAGFYQGLTFHRVEDWVIQGGDPLGNGTGGGEMPTELNNEPFVVGSVGVARGQDPKISNDSQFFITKTAATWLNNQYANFGKVISGMDVVNKIKVGDKILGITLQ